MTKVKALISFSAFGIHARTGQEFVIEDKGQRLDLEKLGWVQPLEYEYSEVSEDMNVTEMNSNEAKTAETKKATRKAKQ